jgi:uncharacterized protein (DUF2267 family)
MSAAARSLDVFETTVHKTNNWLNELGEIMGPQDKRKAYLAMRTTLHALRDRLSVDEIAQLGAQLPMLIRGFYYEGWDPASKPLKERHLEQFFARMQEELKGVEPMDPEWLARSTFTLLSRRIAEGEIEDVKHVLPAEIRTLWP